MADKSRNVRDADGSESKPTKEPDGSESKPTEEPDETESKPTEKPDETESKPTEKADETADPRIADLQARLAAATARTSAVVALANAGLPVSLAGLVAGGSPDDIEPNVEALARAIEAAAAQKSTPAQLSLPPDAEDPEEDMRARARRIFA